MSISIGKYNLTHGLMLAPMAGVTDTVFRKLCKHYGAEYTVSEMVCAKALCYEQRSHRKEAALNGTAPLAAVLKSESPMAVQIFGCGITRCIQSGEKHDRSDSVFVCSVDVNIGILQNGKILEHMHLSSLSSAFYGAMLKAVVDQIIVKLLADLAG